jgi:hypothetical protein
MEETNFPPGTSIHLKITMSPSLRLVVFSSKHSRTNLSVLLQRHLVARGRRGCTVCLDFVADIMITCVFVALRRRLLPANDPRIFIFFYPILNLNALQAATLSVILQEMSAISVLRSCGVDDGGRLGGTGLNFRLSPKTFQRPKERLTKEEQKHQPISRLRRDMSQLVSLSHRRMSVGGLKPEVNLFSRT